MFWTVGRIDEENAMARLVDQLTEAKIRSLLKPGL